jgi:hypothetical protein
MGFIPLPRKRYSCGPACQKASNGLCQAGLPARHAFHIFVAQAAVFAGKVGLRQNDFMLCGEAADLTYKTAGFGVPVFAFKALQDAFKFRLQFFVLSGFLLMAMLLWYLL